MSTLILARRGALAKPAAPPVPSLRGAIGFTSGFQAYANFRYFRQAFTTNTGITLTSAEIYMRGVIGKSFLAEIRRTSDSVLVATFNLFGPMADNGDLWRAFTLAASLSLPAGSYWLDLDGITANTLHAPNVGIANTGIVSASSDGPSYGAAFPPSNPGIGGFRLPLRLYGY